MELRGRVDFLASEGDEGEDEEKEGRRRKLENLKYGKSLHIMQSCLKKKKIKVDNKIFHQETEAPPLCAILHGHGHLGKSLILQQFLYDTLQGWCTSRASLIHKT